MLKIVKYQKNNIILDIHQHIDGILLNSNNLSYDNIQSLISEIYDKFLIYLDIDILCDNLDDISSLYRKYPNIFFYSRNYDVLCLLRNDKNCYNIILGLQEQRTETCLVPEQIDIHLDFVILNKDISDEKIDKYINYLYLPHIFIDICDIEKLNNLKNREELDGIII